jgi:hypothetical protein
MKLLGIKNDLKMKAKIDNTEILRQKLCIYTNKKEALLL